MKKFIFALSLVAAWIGFGETTTIDISDAAGMQKELAADDVLVVNVSGNSDQSAVDWTGITGTGTIKFQGTGVVTLPGHWALGAKNNGAERFSEGLSIVSDASLRLTPYWAKKEQKPNPFLVRNFAGSGDLLVNVSLNGDGRTTYFRTVQTKQSEWSGKIEYSSTKPIELWVASDVEEPSREKALIVTEEQYGSPTLRIESTGCVILKGQWKGTIENNGLLVIGAGVDKEQFSITGSGTTEDEETEPPAVAATNELIVIAPKDLKAMWSEMYAAVFEEIHPGYTCKVVGTDEIYRDYSYDAGNKDGTPRNPAESIHAFIRHERWYNGNQYFILGGPWVSIDDLATNKVMKLATGETLTVDNTVPGVKIHSDSRYTSPTDMYYACFDDKNTYAWDANSDGVYLDPDTFTQSDLTANVVVSRIPLVTWEEWKHEDGTLFTQRELLAAYVAKLRRGLAVDFDGNNRYGIYGYLINESGVQKLGGDNEAWVERKETAFYDNGYNMFDPARGSDDFWLVEGVSRRRIRDQIAVARPVDDVNGFLETTFNKKHQNADEARAAWKTENYALRFYYAHGARGGGHGFGYSDYTAEGCGLTLFDDCAGPCSTGKIEFDANGMYLMNYAIGCVMSPYGGSLSTINNCDFGIADLANYWKGFTPNDSWRYANNYLVGFVQENMNIGEAWKYNVTDFVTNYKFNKSGMDTWMLAEEMLLGDPLVKLPAVEEGLEFEEGDSGVTYTGIRGKTDTVVSMNVRSELIDTDGAPLKVMNGLNANSARLIIRAGEGGIGGKGIEFTDEKGELTIEGKERFYLAGVKNCGRLVVQGKVTLDFDQFDIDGLEIAEGADVTIRSNTRGALTKIGNKLTIPSFTTVRLETWDAFGDEKGEIHVGVESALVVGANPSYHDGNNRGESLNAEIVFADGVDSLEVTIDKGAIFTGEEDSRITYTVVPEFADELYYPNTATDWNSGVKGLPTKDGGKAEPIGANTVVKFATSYGPVYIHNDVVCTNISVVGGANLKIGYWNDTWTIPSNTTVNVESGATLTIARWSNTSTGAIKIGDNITLNGEGVVTFASTVTSATCGNIFGTATISLPAGVTIACTGTISNKIEVPEGYKLKTTTDGMTTTYVAEEDVAPEDSILWTEGTGDLTEKTIIFIGVTLEQLQSEYDLVGVMKGGTWFGDVGGSLSCSAVWKSDTEVQLQCNFKDMWLRYVNLTLSETTDHGKSVVAAIQTGDGYVEVSNFGTYYAGESKGVTPFYMSELSLVEKQVVDLTAFGKTWMYFYTGDGGDLATAANWSTVADGKYISVDKAPLVTANGIYESALLDGERMALETSDDGYKHVTSERKVEGWNLRIGLTNGVCLAINELDKLQVGQKQYIDIDETSRLIIKQINRGKSQVVPFFIAAEEGVLIETPGVTFDKSAIYTFSYVFKGAGSICFSDGYNIANHQIAAAEISLGEGDGKEIRSKKLITLNSAKLNTTECSFADDAAITTDDSEVAATIKNAQVTTDDPIGACSLRKADDGVYLDYVGRKEAVPLAHRVVRAHPRLTRGLPMESLIGLRFTAGTAAELGEGVVKFAFKNCSASDLTQLTLWKMNDPEHAYAFAEGDATAIAAEATIVDGIATFKPSGEVTVQEGDVLWVTAKINPDISADAEIRTAIGADDPATAAPHKVFSHYYRSGAYIRQDGFVAGSGFKVFKDEPAKRVASLDDLILHKQESIAEYNVAAIAELKRLRNTYHSDAMVRISCAIGAREMTEFATAEGRSEFVDGLLAVATENEIDGVDIDWEYPSSVVEWENYGLLMREFAEKCFDKGLVLSMCTNLGWKMPTWYEGGDKVKNVMHCADYIQSMAYGDKVLNSSPMVMINQGIKCVTDCGVPNRRIVVGQAIYAYEVQNPGWDKVVGWLETAYNSNQRRWDADLIWMHNEATKTDGTLLTTEKETFEGPSSYHAKIAWCRDNDMGGAMSWGYYTDVAWNRADLMSLGRHHAKSLPMIANLPSAPALMDGVYQIATEADWNWLAANTNVTAKLTKDITFTYDPSMITDWLGTLDGDNHTLTIPADVWLAREGSTGLFKIIKNGTVKNLKIVLNGRVLTRASRWNDTTVEKGSKVSTCPDNVYVGVLAAEIRANSKIENVTIELGAGAEVQGVYRTGALAGNVYAPAGASLEISNCKVVANGVVQNLNINSSETVLDAKQNAKVDALVGHVQQPEGATTVVFTQTFALDKEGRVSFVDAQGAVASKSQEAYLLNCEDSASAIADKKSAFKFTAEDLAALMRGEKLTTINGVEFNGKLTIEETEINGGKLYRAKLEL